MLVKLLPVLSHYQQRIRYYNYITAHVRYTSQHRKKIIIYAKKIASFTFTLANRDVGHFLTYIVWSFWRCYRSNTHSIFICLLISRAIHYSRYQIHQANCSWNNVDTNNTELWLVCHFKFCLAVVGQNIR